MGVLDLIYIYDAAWYQGYIVKFTNITYDLSLDVPLEKIELPRLALSSARDLVVGPRTYTYVYPVLWKE